MEKELFLKNLWRWKCGLPELDEPERISISDLSISEWSVDFEQLMRNRLILGAVRYGKINLPGKPIYNRVASIQKRLVKYSETGNKEFLVDIANLCLLEFVECRHPKAHFDSIDDGEHVTT